jgi:uncharacterized protein (DUF2236 family)
MARGHLPASGRWRGHTAAAAGACHAEVMSSVLPSPDHYATLVPAPDSPVWRYSSDLRLTAVSGYALLLQVAHPTVGAGVAEHSTFQQDPWGRLYRTLDYVNGSIYGGPELAGEIGRRVRDMHKDIKGVRPDGERYHALEPTAYAWVHATLASAIVHGHERLGSRWAPGEKERFWSDWLRLGRLIGVRERDLPEHWAGFDDYFAQVIREDLVDNPAVALVLGTLRTPARPFRWLPRRVWKVLSRPSALVMELTTVGMLPPALRSKLGLPWGRRHQLAFAAIAAVSRWSSPLLIRSARVSGPNYVRMRRKALARGDVARRSPKPVSV